MLVALRGASQGMKVEGDCAVIAGFDVSSALAMGQPLCWSLVSGRRCSCTCGPRLLLAPKKTDGLGDPSIFLLLVFIQFLGG